MRYFVNRFAALIFLLSLSTVGIAETGQRVVIDVPDITVSPRDSVIAVPVRISFPQDSLAGVEVYFRLKKNPHLTFASDDVREDGLVYAADTSGSIMSGWELINVTMPENTMYDLKVSGMAFWINDGTTKPTAPTDTSLLTTLYFRLANRRSLLPGQRFDISIDRGGTSFSDPQGNSIGIVTTHERRCDQYVGDSCVSWKIARVGRLDTTAVVFNDGSITVSTPDSEKEGTDDSGE